MGAAGGSLGRPSAVSSGPNGKPQLAGTRRRCVFDRFGPICGHFLRKLANFYCRWGGFFLRIAAWATISVSGTH
jgi:hypothetical protein